ncbi:hypothetical protein COCNU_scaffold006434G000020 [Cocos nucifera]|nr:hypothetical protein [Cocos nucifera]
MVDPWEAFVKQGMRQLINRDLTGPFCFLCRSPEVQQRCWVLAVAFIIGYHKSITPSPIAEQPSGILHALLNRGAAIIPGLNSTDWILG